VLRIDQYVQHLAKHGARNLTLVSGQFVRFGFDDGERTTKVAIEHDSIVQLVEEAAPAPVIDTLRQQSRAAFVHSSNGSLIQVDLEIHAPDRWKVIIRPSDGAGQNGHASAPNESLPRAVPAPLVQPPSTVIQPGEPRINALLRWMVKVSASDLHLSSDVPPMVRQHGDMKPVPKRPPMTDVELRNLLFEIMPERNRTQFEATNDTDFAHAIPGVARFRANVFMDRKGIGGVFRQIPITILTPEQIGLPPKALDFCWLSKGLVVVTGPTGSGKSTTLASLVDVINKKRSDHIITIEDPIEFVHENKQCLVNQREVATHTSSFRNALRAALREDPDIVLVGEMRDLETISIAIETAETGHLVFGTLHTTTAISTVDRIIDQFPPDQQSQIRVMLSESLRGVIAQILCKKKGGGRVAAYEILISTPAVSNLIREGKTFQITSVMQTSKNIGMQTLNDHLFELVKNGLVEPEEAYLKAVEKSTLKELFAKANIPLNTTMKE